ncbi:MAG: glycosyl hydrolase [Thermoguttaceae bacterium]
MIKRTIMVGLLVLSGSRAMMADEDLAKGFVAPPDSARPWVYGFWLNGNLTREGITADLEAMKRVGIGGMTLMEVKLGVPKGPVPFGSPQWTEMFKHLCSEASRLGLKVVVNNGTSWSGSGGPWITPELSMQQVVFSETTAQGPAHVEITLPQPKSVANFYRDIAVLALPAAANKVVARNQVLDLSGKFKEGRLAWDAPKGQWVVIRFGHTSTGANTPHAPETAMGLECDKLSKKAVEVHFNSYMGKLISEVGPLAPRTFRSIHVDSWEVGGQNWSPRFREDFQRLRGYDPLPLLPILAGHILDNQEVTARFQNDMQQTVSDLGVANYAGHLRELAHRRGLRLSIEAYDGTPLNEMTYGGQADDPMCEFWSLGCDINAYSCTEMASVAHTYGKRILAAEAFTAMDAERYRLHPGNMKTLGDWALCEGVNRMVFHRYAFQPWPDRRPGMSMGPFGVHYERTQTWWEMSKAWHDYLARCQYILQQGLSVADVCYLESDAYEQRFTPPVTRVGAMPDRPLHNFDGCTPEVLLTRMSVRDGRVVLPDGMSYRVLVMPENRILSPRSLAKIEELAAAGATVIGAPPLKSPGLTNYPTADADVKHFVGEIWGDCDGKTVVEHAYGKGRVCWGKSVEEVLGSLGVPPDFVQQETVFGNALRYIHRTIEGTEVYFVANKTEVPIETLCTFRVPGLRPELWWPQTGRIERPAVYDVDASGVRLPLKLASADSVFVIFRHDVKAEADRLVSVVCDGQPRLSAARSPSSSESGKFVNTFSMVGWVKPTAEIALPSQATSGTSGVTDNRNDVIYPPPCHEVFGSRNAGAGLSVGRNGVCVYEHGPDYFAAPLVYTGAIAGWTHVAVVYQDGVPSLYLNGTLVRTGIKGPMQVRSGIGVKHLRGLLVPFRGEIAGLTQFPSALDAEEIRRQMQSASPETLVRDSNQVLSVTRDGEGYSLLASQGGSYVLTTADGRTRQVDVPSSPQPMAIEGRWEVSFTPNWGAPPKVVFDKLISWSEHANPGVRYYSGTATYRINFNLPVEMVAKGRQLWLDLGKVEVMAEVRLNGKNLGILWKSPYRTDVTSAVHAGKNTLEVKVANLWINRMIGDEELPEDSERRWDGALDDGTLTSWPTWLEEGKPSPTGRLTFTTHRQWKKGEPLRPSGLLGPVLLRAAERVEVDAAETVR